MAPTAFEKRVKRRISGRFHNFFAVCPPGLRGLCRGELEALPYRLDGVLPSPADIRDITPVPGGVEFTARLESACLANLFLGTPTRILMRVARFQADRFSVLEKEIKGVDWELYLPGNTVPEVRATTRKSKLYHSDAIADRCRTLIADRLKDAPGARANAPAGPQTLVARADHDRFELSLDMSGTPLFKRGIKRRVIRAPLRETLAFAMLKRLDFCSNDTLVDPMCGSGTFSLEGAMIQAGLPPGFFRSFAFEAWPGFKARTFAHVRTKINEEIPLRPRILASDLDPEAVEHLASLKNRHVIFEGITARCTDFFDLAPPRGGKGVVVLNPPYGRRLGRGMDLDLFF